MLSASAAVRASTVLVARRSELVIGDAGGESESTAVDGGESSSIERVRGEVEARQGAAQ